MIKFEKTKDRMVPDPSSSPFLQSTALQAYKRPAKSAKKRGAYSLSKKIGR